MKRVRPPMPPLAVRVQVAERQVRAAFPNITIRTLGSKTEQLKALWVFLGFESPQLDHTPALILRSYNPRIKNVAARYTPHAHDPDALIYREKQDHQQKTTGRKPGAERTVTTKGSDIGLKSKFARLEGRTKKRPKAKIAQRKNPWQKRKMR